ncbi:tubulin folding cofactor D [Lycorma delicatula]|uniref:tubulin folding cofactor D n=1 Tax=Lycorma delicatula TaxID=130591 RepID=UPI003F5100C3
MVVPSEVDDVVTLNDDEAVENIGLGCALESFSEWKEILSMINNLKEDQLSEDMRQSELANEKFKYILSQYKEQPHLLDPYLEQILNEIISVVRLSDSLIELKHRAFQYLFIIVNVRGYKVVVRHLPHEVSDLELVLQLLEVQDEKDTATWETRYCLLLWLSIIVMIPFHMARLDCGVQEISTIDRLLNVCKKYLLVADKCRDAAAYLSARLFTRSDVKQLHLGPFFEWIFSQCTPEKSGDWKRFGPLSSLAAILKHGEREDLLPHAPKLLSFILNSKCRNDSYRLTRKYAIKIIQRIGLTFLKVRIATWRYSRGSRSLALNLNAGDCLQQVPSIIDNKASETSPVSDDEDIDVPAEVEEVIEELIQGLRDPDITIRWSAAKGVGRVTARLSKEMGDEVVGSMLDLLNPRDSDAAWHGGCLALAELGKRGLLLPSRLPEVVPKVVKALTYDEPRGYSSVGSHIRDAACYVCWAFARAYDKEVIEPFVHQIANALLIVTCFDREIHCRRAASAAYQENVGRQGAFPHGIDILTAADYFSVGPRNNAYLSISVYIAQFEEYKFSLIDHLVERKVDHWDIAIRELTGKALHKLTEKSPEYIVNTVLPQLIKKTNSIDLNARHGSVICIGEVIHALSILKFPLGDDTTEAVKNLVKIYKERHFYHGLSGELMKLACCHLIEKCSIAQFPLENLDVLDDWQLLIDDCLCHEISNLRTKAAASLTAFCTQYYQTDGAVNTLKQNQLINTYTKQLSANNHTVRMGFAMALGSLPNFMIKGCVKKIITSLIKCTKITDISSKWAESRRDAVRAITTICNIVGLELPDEDNSCRQHVDLIMECFLEGLSDYTQDSRGDVGSWVREASMTGLQVLIQTTNKTDQLLLTSELVSRVMAGIAQQAVERIDKIRAHAGKIFSSLIHSVPSVPYIPYHEQLLELFPELICKEKIDWSSEADTFPRFVKMLTVPPYSYSIMLGFIASVGGLTESLVKHSSSSLFSHLKIQKDEDLYRLGDVIVKIFEEFQHIDRVTVPMMTFLERLFSSGSFKTVLLNPDCEFPMKILNLTKIEISRMSNVTKLSSSVDVFCQLIQVSGKVSQKALGQLCIFLCHKFVWLRQVTATKLYESLMVYNEECGLSEENLEQAMSILSESDWNVWSIEQAREARNSLCQLLNIQAPKLVPKNKTVAGPT